MVFPKTVHELEQVFLKVPDGFLPQLSRARSRGSAQSRGRTQLEVAIMQQVSSLVAEVGDHLFILCRRRPST